MPSNVNQPKEDKDKENLMQKIMKMIDGQERKKIRAVHGEDTFKSYYKKINTLADKM